MNLVYIIFGENPGNHLQAVFSIYTFLAKGDVSTINVITDSPDLYKRLEKKVNVIPVNDDTLREWKGPHNFFWRIKIKAIQMICGYYPGTPVMYLDADTFLYQPADTLVRTLTGGHALMHENEGPLSKAKSKTERKMWGQVKNRVFAKTAVLPSHCMWNAGVVATPNTKNNSECELALDICDEMCAMDVTRRLVEQFALSVSLEEMYGLKEAGNVIAHYWSNKEGWNTEIAEFFLASYLKEQTFDDDIRVVKQYDFSKIPVSKKIKNTGMRIHGLVEKLFPATNISFVK